MNILPVMWLFVLWKSHDNIN